MSKTVVADPEEDRRFFAMLSNPFTCDIVSTKGGEHLVVGQAIEWPDGRFEVHYKSLADYMMVEASDVKIDWHDRVGSDDSQPR